MCCELDSVTSLPSWIQAIGSILTVIVAFFISNKNFSNAIEAQKHQFKMQSQQKYAALIGLIEAVLDESKYIISALDGKNPEKWFEENSGVELMFEFHKAFQQISPLDMPSSKAARLLISIRDLIGTTATSIQTALDHGKGSIEAYDQSLNAIRENFSELAGMKIQLNADLKKSIT